MSQAAPLGSVLVTGGAGYIGSHAVLALKDAGYDVCVIDNLVTGFRWAVPDDVPFYEGDIADSALFDRIVAEQGIAAVMHFAGSVVVPESVSDPLKYYNNNTVRTRALLENIVRHKIPRMIFSSTAAVYGIPDVVPVQEDMPTEPINPYGASKLMTEWMLRDCAFAYPFSYCALRYFNVAGADPKGRAGQSTKNATHLIKVAVEAALGKRERVEIFGSDFKTKDGTGVRDYIHVSDLAQAHVMALRWMVEHPGHSNTLNCGYNRGFSVNEVLDAVDRLGIKDIKRDYAPRRAGDPAELVADNSRILETFGWQPRYGNLDLIVQTAYNWEAGLDAKRRD